MKLKEPFFLLLCLTFVIATGFMMAGSIFEIITCSMIGYVFLLISGIILGIRYLCVPKVDNKSKVL